MHELWLRSQSSVISLTFKNNVDERLSSGSGFKVGQYLVTNNHVIQVPGARRVVLRGVRPDGYTTAFEQQFGRREFEHMLVGGDPETAWDYAVLRVPGQEFAALPSLQLQAEDEVHVGASVALFGYQFEQPHLSMHMGYVSSQYERAGVHYLQLDSSVNQGNSGGPLVDVATGRVLGLVTRKATGLTTQFDELVAVFRQNIAAIEASQAGGARVLLAGVDPMQAMKGSQIQMEHLAREIRRSANVGIGFAYHIKKLRSSLENLA